MTNSEKENVLHPLLIPVRDTLQVEDIVQLADTIWREYYLPIIGEEQIDYMLKKFQSLERIIDDIATQKMEYFLIGIGNEEIGYVGVEWQNEHLLISKLYLLQAERGKGYASLIMQQLVRRAFEKGKVALQLSVNKYNLSAIRFYEKIGFLKIDSVISPIGEGFMMDDYIYQYDFYLHS